MRAYVKPVLIQFPPLLLAAVDKQAQYLGISRAELVRRIVGLAFDMSDKR